jgi:hypothetical protein
MNGLESRAPAFLDKSQILDLTAHLHLENARNYGGSCSLWRCYNGLSGDICFLQIGFLAELKNMNHVFDLRLGSVT